MSSVGNSTLPVKIAFFDIDGTLLPLGVREPSAKIVYTLKELQRNGVILCMATGRGVLAVVGGEFMRYDGLAKVVKDDALLAKVVKDDAPDNGHVRQEWLGNGALLS